MSCLFPALIVFLVNFTVSNVYILIFDNINYVNDQRLLRNPDTKALRA